MAKSLCILFSILALFAGLSFAQDIPAITSDGQKVILKKDGTWKYFSASKPVQIDSSGSNNKTAEATTVFKAKGEKLQVWYNPVIWHQKKSAESDKPTFIHKDGDVYGMVIAERFTMTPEALKEMVVKNAQNAAPDLQVVHEDHRVVNGKKILCLRMEGTIEGVQFKYYGYYYTGKAGIVQLITYTAQNLYAEYEPEMTEFLNGLVIND